VIKSAVLLERKVKDHQGHWLALQIRPYKSLDNRIEGAVLALLDTDAPKQRDYSPATVRE
jgi:two-component system, chemotaxis family, CheB/CheR fusion protein